MTAATRAVWEAAGRPTPGAASTAKLIEDAPGWCAICGHHENRTADVNRALGANFADRGHLMRHDTTRVCTGCLWCCSGKPPATLRMWTIITHEGHACQSNPKAFLQGTPGLSLLNRSNPKPVSDLLSNPPVTPWVLSVSLSGQKHHLPYARTNIGDEWTVRMEATDVTSTSTHWRHVHATALGLRRLGVPADAIPDREPRFIKTRDQLAEWVDLDAALDGWHTSPLLQLALWTITKETMQ